MIEISNLSFRYKNSKEINLKKINLQIKSGECVLLSGRSGCGKTSILRLINGLIPHFFEGEIEGTVTVNNMNIMETQMYKIAEMIGTVYQNPRSQFFNIDTDGEIAFGIENLSYPRKELIRRMNTAIAQTGVESLMGKSIFELSGGEKQKIAFASIYAMETQIILLDEPSANLDAEATQSLRKRITELKEAGKTVIITEHRLYYLNGIVDRVIYMDRGKITADMPSNQFFTMNESKQLEMGLRTVDISTVFPENKPYFKKPILQISNVSAGYKKSAVIKNISFTACAGEVIAIVGSNGAGKSTLAETLCGLNKVLSGDFRYKGELISTKQRINLGYMVFQDVDYQLFADSVKNECLYGLNGIKEKDAEEMLQSLYLTDFTEKHPATLSCGQKQRLAVAVAMLCNKELLIFDEPTSGLDLESMIKVTELIKMLPKSGRMIFIVTHDYEFICRVCNRVLVMNGGQLIDDFTINVKNNTKLNNIFVKREDE